MSYDIDITVQHPDGYASGFEVGNITYNVSRMVLEACGVTYRWFDGMECAKALPILHFAWRNLKRNPPHFRRFEPDNGWGTYEQFMPYMTRFYAMARLHPTGIIRVS